MPHWRILGCGYPQPHPSRPIDRVGGDWRRRACELGKGVALSGGRAALCPVAIGPSSEGLRKGRGRLCPRFGITTEARKKGSERGRERGREAGVKEMPALTASPSFLSCHRAAGPLEREEREREGEGEGDPWPFWLKSPLGMEA